MRSVIACHAQDSYELCFEDWPAVVLHVLVRFVSDLECFRLWRVLVSTGSAGVRVCTGGVDTKDERLLVSTGNGAQVEIVHLEVTDDELQNTYRDSEFQWK